jgi:hypothetical protein
VYVVFVDVESPEPEAALASLDEIIAPAARQMPGIVSGPRGSRGLAARSVSRTSAASGVGNI